MPVYEYHPDELARVSVVRRASGLTFSEVEEQRRAAQDREDRALAAPQEPRKPTELDIAVCQRVEWARIEQFMREQRVAVYSPNEDPRVARREERRAQRMATEAGCSEQADACLPVEVLRYRVYRVTARQATAPAGEEALVRHIFAASAGAAVEHAQRMFDRHSSTCQDGEYRINSVEQVLPEPGEFF
ncbi:hypothetical protein RB625_32935 [Streptomyces californicus]|uniref:hypothetical protein n=1 Tax=Streptomyces californicus TaxID=67351 RepID=UPI00296F1C23|nr:hypothetical protein [Streptomyces californicus]MDW4903220.1 hypothetical protein [Streptomyces californicus]